MSFFTKSIHDNIFPKKESFEINIYLYLLKQKMYNDQ